jgi:hypothetical protein
MLKRISVSFIVLVLALAHTAAAASDKSPKLTSKGKYGQTLSVNKANIGPDGKITVGGKGFDTNVGIYLSLCKQPPRGQQPTPCGGGMDSTAATGSAIWIANNAPSYAANLVRPFGDGGTFRFELDLQPIFGGIDCRKDKCAITVRADHLRSADRSHDLLIPVTFGVQQKSSQSTPNKKTPKKQNTKTKGESK